MTGGEGMLAGFADELEPARLMASMAGRIGAARALLAGWELRAVQAGADAGEAYGLCARELAEVLGEVDEL